METPAVQQAHAAWTGQRGTAHRAPARVNLIGEHTDYTGGLVMPMAIGYHTVVVLSPRADQTLRLRSVCYDETVEIPLVELDSRKGAQTGHWSEYPAGVAWALQQHGVTLSGADITIDGDVPLGAGLSSSASIESATALALLAHTGKKFPLEELAVICRSAENDYVGAKAGVMDQFIVLGGVQQRAMMLDCRSLAFDLLPLPATVRVVVCNSMVRHNVVTGGYGNRSDEAALAQKALGELRPGLELRDASLDDLAQLPSTVPPVILRRAKHIITENARVLAARTALEAGDVARLGQLLDEAHVSMRDDYEASCPEVDTLVKIARSQPGCHGARITGGGFGGCTVNLVDVAQAEAFVEAVRAEYKQQTGLDPQCFITEAVDGALALEKKEHTA